MNNVLFDTVHGDTTTIDGMVIGGTTPAPVTATTLHATGTTALDGAVSGAGFVAAVKAIAGAGQVLAHTQMIEAALPADLVSISNAALATNRALTIAAQPPHARKLQIRQVIVTAITAGVLTLIGTDQDGNALNEVISLIASVTRTLKTANAYAHVTSATVTGLTGGGDGTLGIGVSNDFGIACGQGVVSNFACVKATKATKVLGTSITAADDVASTTTVDAAARTIAPTTAPDASGVIDFQFTATFTLAA